MSAKDAVDQGVKDAGIDAEIKSLQNAHARAARKVGKAITSVKTARDADAPSAEMERITKRIAELRKSDAKVKKLKATRNPDGSKKPKNLHEMTPDEQANLPGNVALKQRRNAKTPAARKAASENLDRATNHPSAKRHRKPNENQK